jgi:hypothetical protein
MHIVPNSCGCDPAKIQPSRKSRHGCRARRGNRAERDSQRSRKAGIQVVDPASQGNAILWAVDLEIEVNPVGLDDGVARVVQIEVDLPQVPIERIACAVLDHQPGFHPDMAMAVWTHLKLQAARGNHQVNGIPGERAFEVGRPPKATELR